MTIDTRPSRALPTRWLQRRRPVGGLAPALLLLLGLSACGSLLPTPPPPPAFYALQAAAPATTTPVARRSPPAAAPVATAGAAEPVLVVHAPSAAPGFDSARIVYTRQPSRLEYFAQSEWVDSPARMLAPLLVSALDRAGGFRSVVLAPSTALGDLQLETQMLRLQHEFAGSPSRVRLSLRAQLVDTRNRRVLATRDFEQLAPSASEDAAGGVAAAQQALQALLIELSAWCREAAATQRPLNPR